MNSLVANLPLVYILMCTCLWVDTFPSSIHSAVRFFVVVFLQNAALLKKEKTRKEVATLSTGLYKGTGPGVCVSCMSVLLVMILLNFFMS